MPAAMAPPGIINKEDIPQVLPILPLRNSVFFPGGVLPLAVGRQKTIALIKDAVRDDQVIGVVTQRRAEEEDRRQKILRLTPRGHAVLRVVDRARAEQFLSAVRPLPTPERSIVAMGVAALATHAISRRGRLIRATREPGT